MKTSLIFCTLLLFFLFSQVSAQVVFLPDSSDNSHFSPAPTDLAEPKPSPTPKSPPASSLERKFLKNILKDQIAIWTSPFRLRKRDAKWLIPLSIGTTALIATDERTAGALDNNTSRLRISRGISYVGSGYGASGTAAAFYIIGRATRNQRARETGILAAEALINAGIVTHTLKFATQRPRPLVNNGTGKFFTGGNSFPSGHSSNVWALAAVIDGEYGKRHPLVRYGVFGLATAVSLSRYTGRKHFLSDILVGSAIGYGIGHFVYLKHHDATLDSQNKKQDTSKLEKYFPIISPSYNIRGKINGTRLTWNF